MGHGDKIVKKGRARGALSLKNEKRECRWGDVGNSNTLVNSVD